MRVKELIKLLKKEDPKKEVHFQNLTDLGYHEGYEKGKKLDIFIEKHEEQPEDIIIRFAYIKHDE